MADKVRYSMSCTPIELVTLAVTYTGEENTSVLTDISDSEHEVLATEVGTSLGGSGEAVAVSFAGSGAIQGYANGIVNYGEASDSSDSQSLSTEARASFSFIINTGKEFDSVTTLGETLAGCALRVQATSQTIGILLPGECLILKDDNRSLNCTNFHVRTVDTAGADNSLGHLAFEYLVVD